MLTWDDLSLLAILGAGAAVIGLALSVEHLIGTLFRRRHQRDVQRRREEWWHAHGIRDFPGDDDD